MGNFISILLIAGAFAFSLFWYGGSDESTSLPEETSEQTIKTEESPTTSKIPKAIPMSDRPRVILFTGTSWCPACVQLQRQVLATSEWRKFAATEIRFQVHNIPADRSRIPSTTQKALKDYNIRAFPTMVVVSKEGRILTSLKGARSSVEAYRSPIMKYVGQ